MNTKKNMLELECSDLSIKAQCELLELSRSVVYYEPVEEFSETELLVMNRMDEIFTEQPFYGHRKLWKQLKKEGYFIGRDKTLGFMHTLGLEAFYPHKKVNTSMANKAHKKYPYLLKGLDIVKPNQVWSIDITYIRIRGGFCYLAAIIDWYSRSILSYRISNSLEVQFCIDALHAAFEKYGVPDIFNSDQGSQFTSEDFTKELNDRKIKISMDSVGRATDNIMIERFFRSLKYEDIYLKEYQSVAELKEGVRVYIEFYNHRRIHQSLDYKIPFEVYLSKN